MEFSKLKLASDIEAKGFYDQVHAIEDVHCLCSIDIETNEVFLFHNHPELDNSVVLDPTDGKEYTIPKRNGSLDEGIKWWEDVTLGGGTLVIHNARTYDQPLIDKIWPENKIPYERYHDTLNQSKVQWFERPKPKGCKGPHGLDAYGKRAGVHKPPINDWSFIDAFKLHRCIEDCKIQAWTYNYLEKERKFFKDTFGADFTQALRIEDLFATECFKQEVRGARVDVPHVKECIKDLDEKLVELSEVIEPLLPPTLRTKGRFTRKEMAEAFGFNPDKVKDEYVLKKKDGEVVETVVKPYVKPSMSFTNKNKSLRYSGFHMEHGASPVYEKKKQLTDWIKENHPDTATKDWGIEKEEVENPVLDKHACNHFNLQPEDTHILCGPHTRLSWEKSTMGQSSIVKSYCVQIGWKHAEEWNLKTDVYDEKIKVEQNTEVRWPEGAAPENQLVKFIPKGGYMVSSPKLSEDEYCQLPEGVGQDIAHYNTYVHRRRFLQNINDPENKGLLSYVREDGTIPCGVINFGTRSGRSSHKVWVNAPGEKALYGDNIRKCIIAREGKVLVGGDMKSAQLSIAAYYAINSEYYTNVAEGMEEDEDGNYIGETAHCVNARMFGTVTEEEWEEAVKHQDPELIKRLTLIRGNGKGGSFAVIFGASGKKVAATLGIPEAKGNECKDKFLKEMGLDDTIAELKTYEAKFPYKRGFMLPLAFGYWLWNNSSHKSVNTIVQGFEALAQKMAVIRIAKEVERKGLSEHIYKILEMHDEVLLEVTDSEEYIKIAKDIVKEAYEWAPEQIFNYHKKNPHEFANPNPPTFKINLDGGCKVGRSYGECH